MRTRVRWLAAFVLLAMMTLSVSGCEELFRLLREGVPPVAILIADPRGRYAPVTVDFDGSNSTDIDDQIVRYQWDFGDGSRISNGSPKESHTYQNPGEYTAVLTVYDQRQNSGSDSAAIVVHELDISGRWVGEASAGGERFRIELNLTQTGRDLQGSLAWRSSLRPSVFGSINTRSWLMSLSNCFFDPDAGEEVCIRLEGEVLEDGARIEGNYRFEFNDSGRVIRGDWNARRQLLGLEISEEELPGILPGDLFDKL